MRNMIEPKNAKDIHDFARDVENLSNENMNELTKAIVETKNAWHIYLFARYVNNLSDENTDLLTKAIVETKSSEDIDRKSVV